MGRVSVSAEDRSAALIDDVLIPDGKRNISRMKMSRISLESNDVLLAGDDVSWSHDGAERTVRMSEGSAMDEAAEGYDSLLAMEDISRSDGRAFRMARVSQADSTFSDESFAELNDVLLPEVAKKTGLNAIDDEEGAIPAMSRMPRESMDSSDGDQGELLRSRKGALGARAKRNEEKRRASQQGEKPSSTRREF